MYTITYIHLIIFLDIGNNFGKNTFLWIGSSWSLGSDSLSLYFPSLSPFFLVSCCSKAKMFWRPFKKWGFTKSRSRYSWSAYNFPSSCLLHALISLSSSYVIQKQIKIFSYWYLHYQTLFDTKKLPVLINFNIPDVLVFWLFWIFLALLHLPLPSRSSLTYP